MCLEWMHCMRYFAKKNFDFALQRILVEMFRLDSHVVHTFPSTFGWAFFTQQLLQHPNKQNSWVRIKNSRVTEFWFIYKLSGEFNRHNPKFCICEKWTVGLRLHWAVMLDSDVWRRSQSLRPNSPTYTLPLKYTLFLWRTSTYFWVCIRLWTNYFVIIAFKRPCQSSCHS